MSEPEGQEPLQDQAPLEDPSSQRLDNVVAILIALVTVLGALLAWRASVAGDAAGGEVFAGLQAAASYQEARSLSRVNAYEHYGVFISYYRHRQLAEGLEKLAGKAKGARAAGLLQESREAAELANASLGLLSQNSAARYLNRDGSFALEREVGALMAAAAKEKDLRFAPRFARADALQDKTLHFLAVIVVLGVSLVFFTLVETFEGRVRYVLTGCGVLLTLGAIGRWIALELGGPAL